MLLTPAKLHIKLPGLAIRDDLKAAGMTAEAAVLRRRLPDYRHPL